VAGVPPALRVPERVARMPTKANHSGTLQITFVVALVAALAGMAITAHDNLLRQGIATGFGFLFDGTGWDVSASLLSQSAPDPYWWTFLVGLSNTIVLSLLCIVLATAAGLILAFLGAGESRILYGFTRLYIWIFRNIPIIVQVFFWYHVTRQFPPVRQALGFLGCCYASNRGVYLPRVGIDASQSAIAAVLAAVGFALASMLVLNRRRLAAGEVRLSRAAASGIVLAVGGIAALATLHFQIMPPRLQGFNFVGGAYLSPEFLALVAAIVAYNVAFVAEIINSGIRSVPRHQTEAARMLGLSAQRTFWRIVVPQAIRVAVPPLINQYISLTKSTSLAIAIGYTDLFSVGVIAINHTGQAIDIIVLMMLIYLVISVGISALGNAYNRSIMARGRR
jgi:general L-amino acid transport system permease protein